MNARKHAAEMMVDAFLKALLVERNVEKSLSFLDEDIYWTEALIGHEASGLREVASGLYALVDSIPGNDGLVLRLEKCREVGSDMLELSATSRLLFSGSMSKLAQATRHTVFLCRRRPMPEDGDVWKIVSMHISMIDDVPDGKLYVNSNATFSSLFSADHIHNESFDIIRRSIPGGMMAGYLEEGFPLYYVNQNMLDYLGFDYDGFVKSIDGRVINGIHPDDRKRVCQAVEMAFSRGEEYEVQYRMEKSDGSYIWVNDIGKKGVSTDGRPVCMSVVRDVTEERQAKERLEREIAEKKRQTDIVENLFQTVMCGIVEYWLNANGTVTFVRANQEAIRIFGCTPEAFWAKKDWNIVSLVAEEDRTMIFSQVAKLTHPGAKINYEYRLVRTDGSKCWIIGTAEVMATDGESVCIRSVYLDIDHRKKAEQENRTLLQMNKGTSEMLRLVLAGTSINEFFYYPVDRYIVLPKRLCEAYGLNERYDDLPGGFADENVFSEDVSLYYDIYKRLDDGMSPVTGEFRLKDGKTWIRQTLSVVQYDEKNRPAYAIGIVEDITKSHEMEMALDYARSRDALTGLYTRETGLRMIRQIMDTKPVDQVCALMILDMDDFARINQEEGSVFADMVLREVADILEASIGVDDIALRLGGDEFMLFIRDCDKAGATVIGGMIATKVTELFSNAGSGLEISVSIGMCVTAVVNEFSGLYRCAESTLQYVKTNGKKRAACYLDTSNELGVMLTQLYPDSHLLNTIDSFGSPGTENLADLALELLGKAKRLDDAVNLFLAKLGKQFGLDRVSIVDIDHDYQSFSYTYQWTRRKQDSSLDGLFYLKPGRIASLPDEYDADGLSETAFHPDSGMASCLRSAIWDVGVCGGAFCFEVAAPGFVWTPLHKKTLKEVSQVVSSFIMKAKSDAVSQAKTDFLSRMSHEIRTPMNAIAGMTTIARSALDDREKVLDCLVKIEQSNRYLLNLINDVLAMSRIESGKVELNPEPVLLEEVAISLDDMMRSQVTLKQLDLRFERHFPTGRPVYLDVLRFSQVFINIIGNAIKFTEPGGSIIAQSTLVDEKDGVAYIRFSVTDTGIGIAPEAIRRIFRSFEQGSKNTSMAYGGTGLGLAISSNLVRMMGGTLEVKSRLGEGSEFYFTLPLPFASVSDVLPLKRSEKIQLDKRDFSGKRVLVVEDNEMNREIAISLLEMHGFVVETADNGKLAVDAFLSHPAGHYDAILMDVRMPVMDGLEATKNIRISGREDARSVPIIAMTANAFDEDTRQSIASGMNGHLSKPVDMTLLLDTLAEYLV